MKTIPEFNDAGDWQLAVICTAKGNPLDMECGAALLVEADDVFVRQYATAADRSGRFGSKSQSSNFAFNVQCPGCGAWTQLPEADIRPDIRWQAQKRKNAVPQQDFRRSTT